MARAMVLSGSTFLSSDSAVRVHRSGTRLTKFMKFIGLGPSKPPPMPIQVRFSGPL
ncbi:hypothetical protein D3C76_1743380 [compost metagenome]